MSLELTEQQRQALADRPHGPVTMIDPVTQREYVLIAADQFRRVADFLAPELDAARDSPPEIPVGIRKSQEALRRALPSLLADKKRRGWWVGYHGEERIGVTRTKTELIKECIRRNLPDDEYYVGWIDESELIEVEDIDTGLYEFDDPEDDPVTP
jgi:hypothetical protein